MIFSEPYFQFPYHPIPNLKPIFHHYLAFTYYQCLETTCSLSLTYRLLILYKEPRFLQALRIKMRLSFFRTSAFYPLF